jgi:hypothetical protein
VPLDVPPQPRDVLDIARSTNAALYANLLNRLHDFDMRSLTIAHLASGICRNALNRRLFRQCVQIQPPPSPTIAVCTPHYQSERMDLLKRWGSGWLRWFNDSGQPQTWAPWDPISCSVN